jgi:hypothetical protein
MEINREFIQAEINQVQQTVEKAKTFLIQAEASMAIFQMLLAKLDQPEICKNQQEEINNG